jgi:hypothetical protein
MANVLDSHHFPPLTDAYKTRADYARACPHCGAPENVIESAPYSRRTLHCPLCGWSTQIRGKREPAERITDIVQRRSVDREDDVPALSKEVRLAQNEEQPCTCCGVNKRVGFSVYCQDCKRLKQREANQRFQAKHTGGAAVDPGLIDQLVAELGEFMKMENTESDVQQTFYVH